MELLLLCFKIFFVRIIDVSLGTFRTMETVKGKTKEATIIGFFELLVWFLTARHCRRHSRFCLQGLENNIQKMQSPNLEV